MALDRRSFIKSALAGVGATALGGPAQATDRFVNLALPGSTLLPGAPTKYPNLQHVVVVMMENRSTDHYLGWWGEREDVRFDARTSLNSGGLVTEDFGSGGDPASADFMNYSGHPYSDPNHGHSGGRHQLFDHDGDGVPDGWTRSGSGTDKYALSFYRGDDLPVIRQILRDFTSFDRYFCSWMGSTYPNRYYMHSAQSHGIDNNDFPPQRMSENPAWATGYDWPTLWDQLNAQGVTWKYYYSNLPAIALFGPRFANGARHISEYFADAQAGTLPQVSFVDPFFVVPEGLANDDHPHADIRLGQEFYSFVVRAFLGSSCFAKGAMFINYDEWGGFWDHVVPPAVGTDVDPYAAYAPGEVIDYTQPTDTLGPTDFGLHGFRTPAFLLSPYARNTGQNLVPGSGGGTGGKPGKGKGSGKPGSSVTEPRWSIDRTVSGTHDHTTILQLICENWGLPTPGQWEPGHSRAPQGSMAEAFDPGIADPEDRGNADVDVSLYAYTAPLEARLQALPIPASSVSALWSAADWIEAQGYTVHTRFADALPLSL